MPSTSAESSDNPLTGTHSVSLQDHLLALAGAHQSKDKEAYQVAQMSLINTLTAEKKVCKQRGDNKIIDGLMKMEHNEHKAEVAKATEKNEIVAEDITKSVEKLTKAAEEKKRKVIFLRGPSYGCSVS